MPGTEWYALGVGVLAVWRLTHLLRAEDGPWDVVLRLRAAAGNGLLGELMDCFYCLSLWVALPFAALLAASWWHGLLLWLALSAGAILIDRATGGPSRQGPEGREAAVGSQASEEPGDGMLRK